MTGNDTTPEEWRAIIGYEGLYEVSSHGRVRSFHFKTGPKILRGFQDGAYPIVVLAAGGKKLTNAIHRLVAQAFILNPDDKPEVNHKDANRKNNLSSNLEWATRIENVDHAGNLGLNGKKLTAEDVIEIKGLRKTGLTYKKIAEMYGVTPPNIRFIVIGLIWKHVP